MPQLLTRTRKTRKPQDFKAPSLARWATDTVERVGDGMHRYLLTFLDLVSCLGFAVALPAQTSRYIACAPPIIGL